MSVAVRWESAKSFLLPEEQQLHGPERREGGLLSGPQSRAHAGLGQSNNHVSLLMQDQVKKGGDAITRLSFHFSNPHSLGHWQMHSKGMVNPGQWWGRAAQQGE